MLAEQVGVVLPILILFYFAFREINSASPPIAGPFDFFVRRAGPCPKAISGTEQIKFWTKLQRNSRTDARLLINVSLEIPLGDNLDAVVPLAIKTSQGWKENYFTVSGKGACQTAKKYLLSVYEDLGREFERFGVKHCPVPPGNYTDLSVSLNVTVSTINVMFYNDYRARVFAKLDGKTVGCLEAHISIVPKKHSG